MKNNENIAQPQRQRTSVVIEGMDTSTPEDIVKDGKCQVLQNMRFKDNAWRPVGTYPQKATIPLDNIFSNGRPRIVYQHPAAGEDSYIVEVDREGQYSYYLVYTNDRDSTDITQDRFIGTFDEEMKISHFGNVLYFTNQNKIDSYILKYGIYLLHGTPPSPLVSVWKSNEVDKGLYKYLMPSEYSTNNFQPSDFQDIDGVVPSLARYWRWVIFCDLNPIARVDHERTNSNFIYWWGEIALFVCYRMDDGSTLSNSPLAIIASETEIENMTDKGWKYDVWWRKNYTSRTGVEYKEQYLYAYKTDDEGAVVDSSYATHPQLIAIAPTITINIPTDLVGIKSCAIYSTRINPLFTPEKERYADNRLAEQPFYLIKDIPLEDFSEGEYSFVLDYSLLSDASSKPVYTPQNNIHSYIPNVAFDYNNRRHIADINVKLFDGYSYDSICSGESSVTKTSYVQLDIDNNKYWVSPGSNNYDKFKEGFNRIISYPDYRAKQYVIDSYGQQTTDFGATILIANTALHELTPSVGNNIAYYTAPSQPTLKYPAISFGGGSLGAMVPDVQSTFRQSNKIMVSALNNPFSWPFENTYAVGSESSKILALQSAAIEMSDTKFGEMPLYAFTEEGIFALQAGENTLYSSVIPINYDKIINPDVLAINYNLVYITEKGVHILNNQGSVLISSPLNTLDGKPLDVWERVKLLDPQSFNEIICFDAGTQMAYIYNLDLQYWSQRTMQVGRLINKTTGVRIDGSNHLIFDITQEGDNNNQNIMIITRPIKLGDLDFKRLETIIPRIAGDCNIAFNVEASNDCKEWMVLRDITALSIAQPFTLRRTPFSAKYFRFIITSTMSNTPLALTNIDLEWYHKFLRRMR